MMINRRYDVLRQLGTGASGEVLLVEDSLEQTKLAMKIFRSGNEGPALDEELFRNEVSTLLQLEHPNLLTIHDAGIVMHSDSGDLLGNRFLVMEYIDGRDALAWLGGTDSLEARIPQIGALLLQALSVLDYVHQEGLIHFDVKPGNLLLEDLAGSPVPRLRLADFGFSTHREMTFELPIRGTLEYTAPELLQGTAFDHRVDLFSLGATFFHLLEGRSPFASPSPVETIKKIMSDEPVLSSNGVKVSRQLIETIKGLMEKDPQRRFRSGREAASVLASGNALSSHFSERPRFVGRTIERKQGEEAILSLKEDRSERGIHVIVIAGTEGMGKTTLLNHLVKFARSHDLAAFHTKPTQHGAPLGAILPVIVQLQMQVQCFPAGRDELVGKYSSLLSQVTSLRKERGLSSKLLQDREVLVGTLARFIVECSAIFPFVLASDDIDRMDEVSMEILRAVGCEAAKRKVLLIASSSSNEVVLFPEAVLGVVSLREFDSDDTLALVHSLFGSYQVGEDFSGALHESYGGIPAVLVQVLHALLDAVRNSVDSHGTDQPVDHLRLLHTLPQSVGELLRRRYGDLDKERQVLVSMVSCFSRPVSKNLLIQLVPFERGMTLAYLHSLETEGLLAYSDDGQAVRVRHGILKDLVYEGFKDKRAVHSQIANLLQGRENQLSVLELAELGYQFLACEDSRRASATFEQAGDRALDILAFQEAIAFYEQALNESAIAGDPLRERGLKTRLASALLHGGRFKEALSVAQELGSAAPSGAAMPLSLLKVIGVSASRLGIYELAKSKLVEALKECVDAGERLELQQELVGIELHAGNYQAAEQQCREQLRMTKLTGNERLGAAVLTDLGILAFHQDRLDEAVTHFEESAESYRKIGNQVRVADAKINIGNVMSARAEYQKALENWDSALRLSREFGTLHQQAQIRNNMGIAHYKLKNFQDARDCYIQAHELFTLVGSKSGNAYVQTNLGEVRLAEGKYEEAVALWTEALSMYGMMEDGRGLAETHLQLAQAHIILGDLPAAREDLMRSDNAIRTHRLSMFEGQWFQLDGKVKCKLGEHGSALGSYSRAIEVLNADTQKEQTLLCTVQRAECWLHENSPGQAADALLRVVRENDIGRFPGVHAEAYYVLGIAASQINGTGLEKPLMYFRKGFEIVEREPVSEITWKLAYALGKELHRRGQVASASEYFEKAQVVLNYFLSGFGSDKMKENYLKTESRSSVFAHD